jgi:hypothetical protein
VWRLERNKKKEKEEKKGGSKGWHSSSSHSISSNYNNFVNTNSFIIQAQIRFSLFDFVMENMMMLG